MNILVTGAAGFIGSNLVKKIHKELPEAQVVGIDNMNDYYDVRLKENRLEELMQYLALPSSKVTSPISNSSTKSSNSINPKS